MKKLGIILDSFAAKDKKNMDKDGYYYLPHFVYVNGKEYIDGVNISIPEAIKYARNKDELKTSLPSPKNIINTFDEISKKFDDVLYITMGSALSGTYQSAKLLAKDYKNITVMDNNIVGTQIFDMAIKQAKKMYAKNQDMKKIVEYLGDWNKKIHNLIIPLDVYALHKSGRIGKSGAFLLNKTKIIPILKYDTRNRVKWLKRTHKKAVAKAIAITEAYIESIDEKFNIVVGYAGNEKILKKIMNLIKVELHVPAKNIFTFKCPPVVIAHLGYGAFSISVVPKI